MPPRDPSTISVYSYVVHPPLLSWMLRGLQDSVLACHTQSTCLTCLCCIVSVTKPHGMEGVLYRVLPGFMFWCTCFGAQHVGCVYSPCKCVSPHTAKCVHVSHTPSTGKTLHRTSTLVGSPPAHQMRCLWSASRYVHCQYGVQMQKTRRWKVGKKLPSLKLEGSSEILLLFCVYSATFLESNCCC